MLYALEFGAVMFVVAWRASASLVRVEALTLKNVKNRVAQNLQIFFSRPGQAARSTSSARQAARHLLGQSGDWWNAGPPSAGA